jgi:hypothetical protein
VYRVPLQGGDTLLPAEREALEARIDETLQQAKVSRVAPATSSTCTDTACWRAEAATVDATYLLQVSVEDQDADRNLVLSIVDVEAQTELVHEQKTCELCGRDELLDATSDVVARGLRVVEAHEQATTSLTIDSVPPGASVLLDGDEVGTTPLSLEVQPGQHTVEVSADGHEASSETLDIARGTRESLRLHLSPIPAVVTQPLPPPPPPRRRRGRIALGSVLLGGGLVAAGGGVAALLLHGNPVTSDCSGENRDADGDCLYLHDTRTAGIISLSTGAAAAVAGAVVLGLELRRGTSKVAFSPTPRGVLVRGRF